MLFTRPITPAEDTTQITTLEGQNTEKVCRYKYLSICLDEHFTFKPHINSLVTKLRQEVGYLCRHTTSFPISCRKQIIEATFLSVLDYGAIIYRHATATRPKPLDSVYHSTLSFITADSFSTHNCILYKQWALIISKT